MNRPTARRAFTIIELAIVVTIVSVLTALALFVVARVKERAARSIIENNLRQLYEAKEFYYMESGSGQMRTIYNVRAAGHLTTSAYTRLTSASTLEAKLGWHYRQMLFPGEPVFAYRGRLGPQGVPQGEVIYYPGPPSGPLTPVDQPPATTTTSPQLPPPTTTGPQVPPPTTTTPQVPVPTTTPGNSGNSGGTPADTQPPKPPVPSNGPGNSDFGHSHQNGNQGHGQQQHAPHNQGKGKG